MSAIVSSNISEVIGRLKRYQEGLPGAIRKALAPGYWTDTLKMVARGVLQAQLAQWSGELSVDEEAAVLVMGLVHAFVDSVKGTWDGAVAEFIAIWDDKTVNLVAALDNASAVATTGQYTFDLDPATVDKAKLAVAEWVANEKVLSEQDDYDVATATERVGRILGLIAPGSAAATAGWASSTYRQYVAGRLTFEIQSWLERQGSPGRHLTPEIVQQWLAAVLLAWRDYVRLHLRERLGMELGALARSVNV